MRKLPLDFTTHPELKEATLMQCISVIIRHYGEEGCTMEDIAGAIQKNLPQWKPASASPAVSYLVKLGCVKQISKFGVRRMFHVRDYDEESDREELARQRASGKENKKKSELAATSTTPQVLLSIAIGTNKTETLTMEEWRGVYNQLHQIFGGK